MVEIVETEEIVEIVETVEILETGVIDLELVGSVRFKFVVFLES